MKYLILTLLSLTLIIMASAVFVFPAHAGSVCESEFTHPDLPERVFGAPFNVYGDHDPLIEPLLCNDDTHLVEFGSDKLNTTIYPTGYAWDGKNWQRLNFISSQGKNASGWFTGSALATVPNNGELTYVVAYMCQDTPTGRGCGCRDGRCSEAKWMLQGIRTEPKETLTFKSRNDEEEEDDDDSSRSSNSKDTDHWVMGYYPSWDDDRLPRTRIPWEMLTHIAVGIAAPRSDGTLNLEFDLGDEEDGMRFAKRVARDARKEGVKSILMIGGGSGNWLSATNDDNVKRYARNLIDAMEDMDFDGIDIDWEPLQDAYLPQVEALARELKRREPDMLLTIAAPYKTINQSGVSSWYGDNAHLFDQINVMTYDMSGAWPGWESWHHSGLRGAGGATPTSIESNVEMYRDAGVPDKKIGIGMPFYGRCWQNVDGPNQVGGSTNGPMSYRLIRREYYDRDNLEWDRNARASYLSFDEPTGPDNCTFITYAEERDMEERGEYIVEEGLGGAIIWSLGQAYMDEYSRSKRNPLLKALWDELE